MPEHLKNKSPSYGHLRLLVQALTFAAVLATASHAAAGDASPCGVRRQLDRRIGLPPGKAFPDRLEAALRARGLDVKVINAGVSGDTAADGLARYDWSVPPDADAMIVELGANDMLRGHAPAATKAALAAILDRARAAHLPVLLAGMQAAPNLGRDYARDFSAIYPALAKSYGVALYPFFLDGVAGDTKLNQPDGLHPTAEGVEIIVQKILPSVEALLKQANR